MRLCVIDRSCSEVFRISRLESQILNSNFVSFVFCSHLVLHGVGELGDGGVGGRVEGGGWGAGVKFNVKGRCKNRVLRCCALFFLACLVATPLN